MNQKDVILRRERPAEYREVEQMVRESFWNVYRPGCLEHFVLKKLRDDPDFVPELDLVLRLPAPDCPGGEGQLIGQNIFLRTSLQLDDGTRLPILTMGPICIANAYKRQGFGKLLLDYSLEQAAGMGFGAVCFEGNIDFYGKSGFCFASEKGLRYHGLPEGADASFFLCRELIPGYLEGVTGVYATPAGYFAADQYPEEFRAYEATFPPLA